MRKTDFSVCEYIEREMWIITYNDFCDRRKGIKRLYQKLNDCQKIFYKWYVYSNVHMNEEYKNYIWDYLNFDDVYFESELMRRKHFYKPKKG
jgi:hypothetical protein